MNSKTRAKASFPGKQITKERFRRRFVCKHIYLSPILLHLLPRKPGACRLKILGQKRRSLDWKIPRQRMRHLLRIMEVDIPVMTQKELFPWFTTCCHLKTWILNCFALSRPRCCLITPKEMPLPSQKRVSYFVPLTVFDRT